MSLLGAVLAVALAAEPDVVEGPVRGAEVGAALGVRSSSYAFEGGRTGVAAGVLDVEGRWLWHLLAVEGGVVAALPLAPNLSNGDAAGLLRVGVSHRRFSVTLGVLADYTNSPQAKWQVLPSLSASLKVGEFIGSAGIFDRAGSTPARLSLEWHGFGAGWVFPLGGEVFGCLPLTSRWSLEARVFAFSLFNSLQVTGLVGLVWS
jgi:hypothetical protein